jgi:hypothetical protein
MNKPLLEEFTAFCLEHPDLSFWQALLKWIQEKHDGNFVSFLVKRRQADGNHTYDTVNWDGEDNPVTLFKDELK